MCASVYNTGAVTLAQNTALLQGLRIEQNGFPFALPNNQVRPSKENMSAAQRLEVWGLESLLPVCKMRGTP